MIPSFIVRMASRPAIFHSPSVPSRGKPLPTSTVPRMPLAERAAGDLPLTVSAVTGEAIADLNGTENAARRAEHYRSVVLNRALMRAPAQLGASHQRLL